MRTAPSARPLVGRLTRQETFPQSAWRRWTRRLFDAHGRLVATRVYHAISVTGDGLCDADYDADESSYADATTTDGDTIFEQSETEYDAAGNVIATTARQRMHDAIGTGELGDPVTEPRARVTYSAAWYDAAGRQIASDDYGTNGGEAFIRPDTVPDRSDTCLVTSTLYNARGEAFCTIDPMGRQDRVAFDDAGRTIETVENFSPLPAGEGPGVRADANKTTRTTYTPDGQVATLTAVNPTTGDQTTRYIYGSTFQESFVARSDLLRAEIYPDSDDSRYDDGDDAAYDRIEYSYNALGQRKSFKDQNGTVRGFRYDKLGRLLHDYVETLGPGVDGRVRRISRTYGLAGRLEKLTSYTQPYPKTGGIESQVVFCYSHVGLPVAEYQSHHGPVYMLATPQVQYAYDDTLDAGELVKGLRPTRTIYPNGRVVRYEYGESGSSSGISGDPDDCLNRIKIIADDDEGQVGTHLAEYTRLGLGTIVRVDYTQPQIRYDLAHGAGSDPCAGLDRFGRVVDLLWRNYGTAEDVVRIRHGYDRAGNRLYREDPVAAAHGVDLDEVYTYDGVYQLKTFVRGAPNAQKTAIAAPTFRQAWDFDTTGNWSRFREDKDGDGRWDLDQTRQHNAANELTAFESNIGDLWISPLHDRNGNMIRIPQPKDPTRQFTLRYDPWNRLVRVSDPAGPVADYHYDGRNFRTVKEVHRDPNNPIPGEEPYSRYPETRHFYYNSSWQCLEERASSSTAAPADSLPADRQFVWGLRYIDDLLLRDRHTQPAGDLGACDSGLDERLYALQDPNWNVVGIVDATGAVAERYSYAAYGAVGTHGGFFNLTAGSHFDWEYRFTGRRLDRSARFQESRHRYLLAKLGLWLTRDPIGFLAGDTNLYRYVAQRPTILRDPIGVCPEGFSELTDADRPKMSPGNVAGTVSYEHLEKEFPKPFSGWGRTAGPGQESFRCECSETGRRCVRKGARHSTGLLIRAFPSGPWESRGPTLLTAVGNLFGFPGGAWDFSRRTTEVREELEEWDILNEFNCSYFQYGGYTYYKAYQYKYTSRVRTGRTVLVPGPDEWGEGRWMISPLTFEDIEVDPDGGVHHPGTYSTPTPP